MLKIPDYFWFQGLMQFHGKGNTYIGSIGTDPSTGIFSQKILNYRMWIEQKEDGDVFHTVCYWGTRCFEDTPDEEKQEKLFEGSDNGVLQAGEWVEQIYAEGLQ